MTRPFISIVGDQPELDAGFALSGRQGERDRPDALGRSSSPRRAKDLCVRHHPAHWSRQPAGIPNRLRHHCPTPGRVAALQPPAGGACEPSDRLPGRDRTMRHLVDQEDEMVGIVHDVQPRVRTGFCHTPDSLPSKRVGSAAHGPVIVAHLVGRQRHGIPSRIRQQAGAEAKPLLGQRRMEFPGQRSRRRRIGNILVHD